MLLPRKVGPFTLMRKLDGDGMAESYVAILESPAGKQIVARRLMPIITRDPARVAQIRSRVADLRSGRHPALAAVLDLVDADGELYVLEEQIEGVDLRRLVDACTRQGLRFPHNVYLNIAAQICNALEALHARPGIESASENVLHLALNPSAIWLTADGKVTLGRYGLSRAPTTVVAPATGALPARVEYLAPEQTHQDQKLTPASDLFSLGAVLYELLSLQPMFRAETHLQTIHRVRKAEVTTQLLEVKEILPGLDKVLFRSLSLNARHRYQRAFVLREDLRALMAGYSFSDIEAATRSFLAPLIGAVPLQEEPFETDARLVPPTVADPTGARLTEVPDRGDDLSESPGTFDRRDDDEDDQDDEDQEDTAALIAPPNARTLALLDGGGPHDGEDTVPARQEFTQRDLDGSEDGQVRPSDPVPSTNEVGPSPPEDFLAAIMDLTDPSVQQRRPEPAKPPAAQAASVQKVAVPSEARLDGPDSLVPPPGHAPPATPRAVATRPEPTDATVPTGGPVPSEDASGANGWLVGLGVGVVTIAALVCLGGGGLVGLATLWPSERPEPLVERVAPPDAPPSPPPTATPETAPVQEEQVEAPRPEPSTGRRPSREDPAAEALVTSPPPPTPPRDLFRSVVATTPTPQVPVVEEPVPVAPTRPRGRKRPESTTPANAPTPPPGVGTADLEAWSGAAFAGALPPDARSRLTALEPSDPAFTRGTTLMLLDAAARGDVAEEERRLAAIFSVPENKNHPVFLEERARAAVERRDWGAALVDASAAELNAARFPSDLAREHRITVLEIQAVANAGLFYASERTERSRLDDAVSSWQRYRSHVVTLGRTDLVARADERLAALRSTRERLE